MGEVRLEAQEEEALYAWLKPSEDRLSEPLRNLLRRIERELFQRLTIEELESLPNRFPEARDSGTRSPGDKHQQGRLPGGPTRAGR